MAEVSASAPAATTGGSTVEAAAAAATSAAAPAPTVTKPAAAAAAAVPPGERYVLKPWHTALLFVLAFLLDLPFWVDWMGGHYYPVHKTGGVLVTGASTGIGRDAAVGLAQREKGFVVFAAVRSGDAAKALKSLEIENLVPITMDVASDRSIDGAYKAVTKELQKRGNLPFIGLVNNAGKSEEAPLEFHSAKNAQAIFDVNFFGVLKTTQKFLPLLRQSKGRIVNISSLLGVLTVPGYGLYSASKHAMEAASDAWRRELRPLDVSVSVVQPGYIKTTIHGKVDEFKKSVSPEAKAAYPHLFDARREAVQAGNHRAASPTKVTTSAIHQALTSPTPKARYTCGNVGAVPAAVVMWSADFLPDRLVDYLLLK